MNEKLLKFKKELKETAAQIREMKAQRKSVACGYVHGLSWLQLQYRYDHIAYCLARGRTYEQIEPFVHDCNKLSEYRMDDIKTKAACLIAEGI